MTEEQNENNKKNSRENGQEKKKEENNVYSKELLETEEKEVLPAIEKNSQGLYIAGENLQKKGEQIDVKMLLHNHIPGMLPLQIQYIDNKECYFYQITGRSSMEKMLEKDCMGFFMAMKILDGIVDAVKKSREYFLKEEHYILNPAYVFWHERKKEVSFCYFPGYFKAFDRQMDELCQYLLQKIDHKDKACVELIYGIYELLQQEGAVVEVMDEYLRPFRQRDGKESKSKDEVRSKKRGNVTKVHQPTPKKNRKENGGVTEFYLKKVSKKREMPDCVCINKENFLIGRSEENDFVLPADQISRQHAKLYRDGTQWYLLDQNSTNGVFLNGNRLMERCPVACGEKDIISFADISYCIEKGRLDI